MVETGGNAREWQNVIYGICLYNKNENTTKKCLHAKLARVWCFRNRDWLNNILYITSVKWRQSSICPLINHSSQPVKTQIII